jgi:hypothetical protein
VRGFGFALAERQAARLRPDEREVFAVFVARVALAECHCATAPSIGFPTN